MLQAKAMERDSEVISIELEKHSENIDIANIHPVISLNSDLQLRTSNLELRTLDFITEI
jgi:hypothetical protein